MKMRNLIGNLGIINCQNQDLQDFQDCGSQQGTVSFRQRSRLQTLTTPFEHGILYCKYAEIGRGI